MIEQLLGAREISRWGSGGFHDLDQLKNFNLDPAKGRGLFTGPIFDLVDEAVALRQKIEAMPSNTVEDVEVVGYRHHPAIRAPVAV